ncbi:MAG: amidohydrolase, partial [Actinobacteria bacterium]|nr:amidohydrolase [Actinomycetota bacterium]
IDLRGRLLLPAFGDAHAHASAAVAELYSAQLFHLPTVDACRDALRRFLREHPDLPVISGEGWTNTIAPRLGPRKEVLDELVGDRPVVASSEDYHSLWVNSRALELAGITAATADPPGGVIERLPDGEPAGTLRETAMDLVASVLPDFSEEQYREGILHYQRDIAAPAGITLVFDPVLAALGRPPGESASLRAYRRMAEAGELTLRARLGLTITPQDDPTSWVEQAAAARDDLAAVSGAADGVAVTAAKFFEDGVIEGHTAYLLEDYADAPGDRGEPLWEKSALGRAFAAVDAAGLQIHVHCIGDAATAETLDAFEYARGINGAREWRPAITHVQMVAPPDFRRFADMGVVAAVQPFWFVLGDYYRDLEVPFLGPDRAAGEYPFRSFLDAGAPVAGGSDFPVTKPCDPLIGMQAGVMRWLPALSAGDAVLGPAERGTVRELVDAYTSGAAFAHRLETVTGSIARGKSADLVVLDRDLFSVEPAEIGQTRVLLTLFEGRPVHVDPAL